MPTTDLATCPNCGAEKDYLGNHWALSKHCDYPPLKQSQQELVDALLLAGGSLTVTGKNPVLSLESPRTDLFDWLTEKFGPLANGYSQTKTADEQREQFEEGWGVDASNADFSDLYKWRSRSHPDLHDYREDWYTTEAEGSNVKQLPDDFELTPLMVKFLYARRGWLSNWADGKQYVALGLRGWADEVDRFRDLLDRFNPRVGENEGRQYLRINDAQAFFDYLASDPITGAGPLPGFADSWPDDEAMLSTVDQSRLVRCPQCGDQFTALGNHWAESTKCDAPGLTPDLRSAITGAFMYRGGTSSPTRTPNENPSLQFNGDRAALEWLDDELGELGRGVVDREVDVEIAPDDPPSTRPVLFTRNNAAFAEFAAWMDDGEKTVPEAAIASDPMLIDSIVLRAFYAFAGTLRRHEDDRLMWSSDDTVIPRLHIPPHLDSDFVAHLLSGFDPEVIETRQNVTYVDIGAPNAFFEYIGGPPTADLRRKWGPHSGRPRST